MRNYKTVEEKASEWDLSPRHVQYLCRSGKIQDAEKHAGVWLIPSDTLSPAKYSKSNTWEFNFTGTKKLIFDSAIELFVINGFNNVSLRDIAHKVGIRQSTIYNHFKSKQELLDAIYDFYCHYYTKDRPSLKEMELKLQNESIIRIINHMRYDFGMEYEQKMSDITKIIFQRVSIDERARSIGKSLMMDEGVKYVEDVFKKAIEIGRFSPFDTHAIAVLINSIRLFTLYHWMMDPSYDNMMKALKDEQTLYKYAAHFIKDLKI